MPTICALLIKGSVSSHSIIVHGSYDARNKKDEPRHLTLKDDWGLRLYFRVWPSSRRRTPALMIERVEPLDAGMYRCRVDYQSAPTSNFVTKLSVIGM